MLWKKSIIDILVNIPYMQQARNLHSKYIQHTDAHFTPDSITKLSYYVYICEMNTELYGNYGFADNLLIFTCV